MTNNRRKSKNAPEKAPIVERRRAAVKYRKAGATYDEIVELLERNNDISLPKSYGREHAWRDVDHELSAIREETREDAREILQIELERLDGITRSAWPRMLAGDDRAAQTILRAMDRRAKYLGLDAPERHELTITPDMVTAEIQRLETKLADNDAVAHLLPPADDDD